MTDEPTGIDAFYALFPKNQPRPVPSNVTPIVDPERGSRYATKALRSEAENVAVAVEGTRNHTLNSAAFSISQLVAAGHLEHTHAWDALWEAGRACGLPDTEIEATLGSGFRAGAQLPRVIAERPPVPEPTVLTIPAPVALEAAAPALEGPPLNPCIDWHELWSRAEDNDEWIVEPLLPARRMVALYSAPKAGKSLLMLELAVAVARGTPVLGTTPDRPYRVLYVDFENDPQGDILTRLEAMDVGPDGLGNLCYLTFPSLAWFDTAAGAADLLRHVEAYDCEVVIIDTVSRAVSGEENDNDTWLSFYRHTGLALKRAGVACIRLDHSGKDREKGMRGGSAKAGDVDAVWRLTALSETTILLECTDQRMPVPVKRLTLTRKEWPLEHRIDADVMAAANTRVTEVDEQLTALQVPNQASVRDATKALRRGGYKARNDAIRGAVRERKGRLDIP